MLSLLLFTEPALSKERRDIDRELMRILLSTFLGMSDLKNALEVAKKGIQVYSSDPFWWEWYGKISGWLGYREEALRARMKLLELKPNEELVREVFRYAVSVERYDFAVDLLSKYPYLVKDLSQEELFFIYLNAGKVEDYLRLAEDLYLKEKKPEYLYYMALANFEYKDKKKAISYMKELEELRPLNLREILLYSDILQALGMQEENYALLKRYLDRVEKGEEELLVSYYMRLSALAWSMRDFEVSVLAAELLDGMNKAGEDEYIRLYLYYATKRDYVKAVDYARKGYEKTGNEYAFNLWVEGLTALSRWKEVLEVFRAFDKRKLLENSYLFSLYVRALYKTGEAKTARDTIIQTLQRKPSKELLSDSIYLAVEFRDLKLINHILTKHKKEEGQLPKEFAFLYLTLQDGLRAKSLMGKLKEKDKEDLLLYSFILYVLGREEESKFIRSVLSKELSEIKNLEEDPQMLRIVLSSGMGILPAVRYQELLSKGKQTLPKEVWLDIYLSYLFTNNAYERIERMRDIEKTPLKPWMELSLALRRNDKERVSRLLEELGEILPHRDVVESYRRLGLKLTAMGHAYRSMEKNPEDALLYEQMRQLTDEYGSNFQTGLSYRIWEKIEYLKNETSFRFALNERWYLLYDGEVGFLSSSRNPTYTNLPRKAHYHTLSLRRWSERGYQQLSLHAGEGLYGFAGFTLTLSGRFFRIDNLSLSSYFNAKASENLIAHVGLLKDGFSLKASESITPRVGVSSAVEYSWFKSQDMKYMGSGFSVYASLFHRLRYAYPDYTYRLYLSFWSYREEREKSQSILRLYRVSNPRVLPESAFTVGAGFSFGMSSKEMLSRPLLPFLDSEVYYNTRSGFGYGLSTGVTGRLLGRDLFTIGLKGFSNFQATGGFYLEPFTKYRLNF
ncbi:MAG: tetratricopeptide repeat protein [Aquificaceae bacterium]|nr:tetratricopeptide repeat protein [Aquificaceae bacterium]